MSHDKSFVVDMENSKDYNNWSLSQATDPIADKSIKYSDSINSILSLDDTLLKDIEINIENEIQYTQKMQNEKRSVCSSRENSPDIFQSEIEEDYYLESQITDDTVYDCLSPTKSVKQEIEWKNDTLFNGIFTQFDTVSNINECAEQIDINISNKRLCLSDENKKKITHSAVDSNGVNCNNSSFYGLPKEVKNLIYKIKGINTLYDWQDEFLKLDAIINRKNLIYALPTSGGKTLVAEILMLKEILCYNKNVMFILPYVAVVQEKIQSMTPLALELNFLVEEYAGSKGQYPPKKRRKKRTVFICTIEKAAGFTNSLIELKRLQEIGLIVIDELHLLGESGGRGATLEALLTKIMYANENIHLIGMSATIGNLEEIAQFLNAEVYTGNFRPVEIKEYVKCQDDIGLIDLQTEDIITDIKKLNYSYSKSALSIDPDKLGGLVMDVVPNDSCLIFCANRKNCENVALLLTKVLFRRLEKHKQIEKQNLLTALEKEEGLCPILQRTIKFGVAYHHSGLTSEERKLIEDAFREGVLCVICCTSTLAAGINLPARRVILRSPYIGSEFLSVSRYKQMVGRAGRAGFGNSGESILICKLDELPKVKELLISKMDDSLSTLHEEKDRGINNLILSTILLFMTNTRAEVHKLMAKSLLSIQQKRLNVNVKAITDETIHALFKSGIIKVKKTDSDKIDNLNLTVLIPSQESTCTEVQQTRNGKRVITLTASTRLELCDLGRAAMKASINLQTAYILYQDLKVAQQHLILTNCLHLLYLITPYDVVSQVKPSGKIYFETIINFSDTQMEVVRLLKISEAALNKLQCGITPREVNNTVLRRFYATLILYDLCNHQAVNVVAEKYQISKGIIQNLWNTAASFSFSVIRFCQELEEFWAFRDLLTAFSKKLYYCCPPELEILMELPSVKLGRAYQLYKAGYTTLKSIAKTSPQELQKSIKYLPKRVAIQIISAASLLLLEKIEDLQDEVEDVLDGININDLKAIEMSEAKE